MKVIFASDHAGFVIKNELVLYARELGHDVDDFGALENDVKDDFPSIVAKAARVISEDPKNTVGIILGGSGQGEAMVANRFAQVRAAVYYGDSGEQIDVSGNTLSIVESVRKHNHANILSLGARFISEETAKDAVKIFLETEWSAEERHVRRVEKIDEVVH